MIHLDVRGNLNEEEYVYINTVIAFTLVGFLIALSALFSVWNQTSMQMAGWNSFTLISYIISAGIMYIVQAKLYSGVLSRIANIAFAILLFFLALRVYQLHQIMVK